MIHNAPKTGLYHLEPVIIYAPDLKLLKDPSTYYSNNKNLKITKTVAKSPIRENNGFIHIADKGSCFEFVPRTD